MQPSPTARSYSRSPRAARLRTASLHTSPSGSESGASPVRRGRHTLLAVCPTSRTVTRAALAAAQRAQAPLFYAATLNQVDRDGGYTGWTPHDVAAFVDREADRLDIDVPVVLGLDHGGPWKKDAHVQKELDYETSLSEVKASLRACIDAGYELLHLDPTTDLRLPDGQPVPIDDIVDRTVELMQFAEDVRESLGRPPIAYEVGTEEVGGGLQSEDRFYAYLHRLSDALSASGLPAPQFVVGDVGTKLDTAHFNAVRARRLTAEALSEMGALLKGHYTDDVQNLVDYPLSGMGGANVGPGFAAVERDALRELGAEIVDGVDVTDPDAVRRAARETSAERIDVLVNDAGILAHQSFDDLDGAEAQGRVVEQFMVNALGPILVTRALVGKLGEGSKVALVTSRMGSIGDNDSGGNYGYRMSKAALNAAGKSLALDLGARGIAVGILHPGFVKTEMTGSRGHVEPAEAAAMLVERIDELDTGNAGRFLHANGEELPW